MQPIEIIYTSEPQLSRFRQFTWRMLVDLWQSKALGWRLFVRNIRTQYRQSILGYFWAVIPPVVTTLVWVFLNATDIFQIGETDLPYPVYVLVGTLLWQGFVDALNSPFQQLTGSQSMLTKINFPREALILAGLGEVIFSFIIRLILVIVVLFIFRVGVSPMVLMAPMGIIALLVLGITLGLLLAPLAMLYPVPTSGPAALLARLNPVSPLLVTTREMLTHGAISQLTFFLFFMSLTFIGFIFSWIFFRLAMPHIIERLSVR